MFINLFVVFLLVVLLLVVLLYYQCFDDEIFLSIESHNMTCPYLLLLYCIPVWVIFEYIPQHCYVIAEINNHHPLSLSLKISSQCILDNLAASVTLRSNESVSASTSLSADEHSPRPMLDAIDSFVCSTLRNQLFIWR